MKIVQISDMHLLPQKHATLHEQNPYLNFSQILKQVVNLNPEFLILSGDLTHDDNIASYQILKDLRN